VNLVLCRVPPANKANSYLVHAPLEKLEISSRLAE
jgi:hypothetical protein